MMVEGIGFKDMKLDSEIVRRTRNVVGNVNAKR